MTDTRMSERDHLAAVLMTEKGFDETAIALYRNRSGVGNGRDHWRDALETADAILAAGFTRPVPVVDEYVISQVLDQVALAIETADTGLEVESSHDGLIVSWPFCTEHPQPPGVPSNIRVTVTEES